MVCLSVNFSPADLARQTNFRASKNQTTRTSAAAQNSNNLLACFNKANVDESILENRTPIIETTTIETNSEKLFLTVNPQPPI